MNDFKDSSNYFLPNSISTLFIAESPPGNGSFFFFNFAKQEILLTSLTTALFGDGNGFDKTKDKVEFLKKFKDQGYFLTDAVSFPIAHLTNNKREKVIEKEYLNLQKTLNKLIESSKFSKKMSKIILIKETVYNIMNKIFIIIISRKNNFFLI